MSSNREIVFSARDTGVESTMSRLRRSAKDLQDELGKEAASKFTSLKEINKYYEEQIRLIERRNREDYKTQRQSIDRNFTTSMRSASSQEERDDIRKRYAERNIDLERGAGEDRLQLDLLRELIQAVQDGSRDTIESNRTTAENNILQQRHQLSDDTSISTRNTVNTTDRQLSRNDTQIYNPAETLGDVGTLANTDASGATNLMMGRMSKAGAYGLLAYGGYKVATGLWNEISSREKEYVGLSQISGNSVDELYNYNFGTKRDSFNVRDMNVTREEFNTMYAPAVARSYGSAPNLGTLENRGMRAIQAERGMGLDSALIMDIAKLTRTTTQYGDLQGILNQVFSSMKGTGVLGREDKDMSRMEEMVRLTLQLQNTQLMRGGGTFMQENLKTMRSFSRLGGNYSNDQYLSSAVSGIDSGLAQSGGAEVQAMKYSILSRLNPNMDVFDLEGQMQKGLQTPGYLQSVLTQVKSIAPEDKTAQKILLQQMLGGSVNNDVIKDMIENPDFNLSNFSQSSYDFSGKSKAASSSNVATEIAIKEGYQDVKKVVADVMVDIKDGMLGLIDDMRDYMIGSPVSNTTKRK